jgi:predicted dehydrogenase
MDAQPLKVGIVGLGRWAKVLTRAAGKSGALAIAAGHSRSEEKRTAFQQETGVPSVPSLEAMLADPSVRGVILTVPNEQHLPVAAQVAASASTCIPRNRLPTHSTMGCRSRRSNRSTG